MSDTVDSIAPRQRLIDALGDVLADKPLADVTVADIVARAHVSKRTFYEQFDTKEACALALCERFSQNLVGQIAASYDHGADWVEQLARVTHAYLATLQARPALLRAFFIDLHGLGPQGLKVRRQVQQTFAEFLRLQVDIARLKEPHKRPLDAPLATAVVGGITELILQALEDGRGHELTTLAPTITGFVQAVLESLLPLEHRLNPTS